MRLIDLTGQKFNRLTVIEYAGKSKWLCKCDCGNQAIISGYLLKTSQTKSCGCYNHEKIMERNYTHRMTHTHIYTIWYGMKDRCYRKTHTKYSYYGGKGIRVRDKWLKFEGFYEDMKESYNKHVKEYGEHQTTLDRIDSSQNYCKENCKWSTYKEQANNKSNNVIIQFNGKNFTLEELSKKYKINHSTLYNRIFTNKWDIKRAITEPVKSNKFKRRHTV